MTTVINLDSLVIRALRELAAAIQHNDSLETGYDKLEMVPKKTSPDYADFVSVGISPTTMAHILGIMAVGVREAYSYTDGTNAESWEASDVGVPSIALQNCPFSGREEPFDLDGPEGSRALVDRVADAVDEMYR